MLELTSDVGGFIGGLFRYLLIEKAGKICEEDTEGPAAYDARFDAKKHHYLSLAYETIVSCMLPQLREELRAKRDEVLAELTGLS